MSTEQVNKDGTPPTLLKRLLTGTFNYGIGSILPRVIGFFLIPLYTVYLTPTDYGIVEICGSLSVFLVILMRLGIPGSVSRFYYDHKDDPQELNDYVTTVHHFLLVVTLSFGVGFSVFFYFFSEYITPGVLFFPFILLVIINGMLSANSDIQKRLLQSKEKSRYSAVLSIVNAFIGIVAAVVMVVGFKLGAVGFLLSQLLTSTIFFIQAQYYLRRYLTGQFRRGMLGDSLKYGLHILPHHLFTAAAPLLSKLVLVNMDSLTALGVFSLAARFTQPLDIMYSAFNHAYQPIYFSLRKAETNAAKISRIIRLVWLGALVAYSGTALILPSLIPLITPERFHAAAELIPIIATGFIWQVLYFLYVSELYYLKETKRIPFITFTSLSVNLIFMIVFVKWWGVEALAWSQVMGAITLLFGVRFSLRNCGVNIDKNVFIYTNFAMMIFILLVGKLLPIEFILIRFVLFLIILIIIALAFIKEKKTGN